MANINEQHLLNKLLIFKKVAELKSVTKAAQDMGVSKAAISRTIRQLEESIGLSLLQRSTRNMAVTEEGQHILVEAERLFNEYDTVVAGLTGMHEKPKGRLRIAAFQHFVDKYLLDVIANYLKRYPDVQIDLITQETIHDMERDAIDIMFGISIEPPLDIVAKKIGKTKFVLCASSKYLKTNGIPKTLTDLTHHAYIEHSARTAKYRISISKQIGDLHLKPIIKLNSVELIKKFILKDLGIALLHDYFIEEEIKAGKLIPVLEDSKESVVPIYVFYQKHRYVQPKIRKFIELLQPLEKQWQQ